MEWLFRADPDVVRHAVRVSVWGRWFIWLVGAGMLARRPGLWYPEDIGFVFLSVSLAVVNGVVHYRLLTNRPVTWRWMLALGAMDIALITATIAVGGRFDNLIFVSLLPGPCHLCRGLLFAPAHPGLGDGGVELTKRILGITDVPVIFLSGHGGDQDAARALEAGADDYIVKPFSPTELVARIEAVLRSRRRPTGPGRVNPICWAT